MEILKFVKCIKELENLVSNERLYAISYCNILLTFTFEDTGMVKYKLWLSGYDTEQLP